MGYRAFNDNTTFDDADDSSLYTVESAAAYPDPAVGKAAAGIHAKLDEVDEREAERRKARRATIRASARSRAASARADDEIGELAKDVLGAVRQDRGAPFWISVFPIAPADIKAMSIEPKMKEIDRMIGAITDKKAPAELRKAWSKRLADVAARGAEALGERKAAEQLSGATSLRIAAWIVAIDRERRKLDGALTTYAAENDLPRDFNDRFFPPAPAAPKAKKNGKAKKDDAPTEAPKEG